MKHVCSSHIHFIIHILKDRAVVCTIVKNEHFLLAKIMNRIEFEAACAWKRQKTANDGQ